MRFLLDENISPAVSGFLEAAGHAATHVRDVGLGQADDEVVLGRAREDQSVLISADTDFGQLLAATGASSPSVILLRREIDRRAHAQAGLVLANLAAVEDDIDAGAVVVIEATRVRVRRLPIG